MKKREFPDSGVPPFLSKPWDCKIRLSGQAECCDRADTDQSNQDDQKRVLEQSLTVKMRSRHLEPHFGEMA
jgi:hypothetical protein